MINKPTEKTLRYGKGDVFAYRTHVKPLTGITLIPESSFNGRNNIIFGMNAKVAIGGPKFVPSFTEGDNSLVIATDSIKNFMHSHLATFTGTTLEDFIAYVSTSFLKKYPQINTVHIQAEDLPFEVVSEASLGHLEPSNLVFKKSRNERSAASIEMIQTPKGPSIHSQFSSVLDLQLIKVSGNSFVGFVRDEYTTLPETEDRPLFAHLNIHWVYEKQEDAYGKDPSQYVAAEQITDITTSVFHETETPSIQNLVFEIGCKILTRFPHLLEVTFETQNHTWDTVVADVPHSNGKVYTELKPPYGFQVFTVTKELMETKHSEKETTKSL